MTYKEKLIELLKEVPEIKEDLEEWREWYKLLMIDNWWALMEYGWDEDAWWEEIEELIVWPDWETYWDYTLTKECGIKDGWDEDFHCTFKIIWNPIEERHLRIYLSKKCCRDSNDEFFISDSWELVFYDIVSEVFNRGGVYINNTQSFDNQKESVYEDIYNFLIE